LVPGAAVEVRYKGRLAWFPGTITNVSKDRRKGERFDITYADGDSEKAVPRIRVRDRYSKLLSSSLLCIYSCILNVVLLFVLFFTLPLKTQTLFS
jgi:hypothetical protein